MLWMYRKFSFLMVGFIFSGISATANSTPGIKFIENKNQWPSKIHFSARVPGGNMSFQAGKFLYYFLDEQRIQELHEHSHQHVNESDGGYGNEMVNGHAVQVSFVGANLHSIPLPFG